MDEARLRMLGQGAARKAGEAKSGRTEYIDRKVDEAVSPRPVSPPPVPPTGNSQTGLKGFSREEKLQQQKKLAEMLRKRGDF